MRRTIRDEVDAGVCHDQVRRATHMGVPPLFVCMFRHQSFHPLLLPYFPCKTHITLRSPRLDANRRRHVVTIKMKSVDFRYCIACMLCANQDSASNTVPKFSNVQPQIQLVDHQPPMDVTAMLFLPPLHCCTPGLGISRHCRTVSSRWQ